MHIFKISYPMTICLKDVDEIIQGVLSYEDPKYAGLGTQNTPCGWGKCAFFRFFFGPDRMKVSVASDLSSPSYQLAM